MYKYVDKNDINQTTFKIFTINLTLTNYKRNVKTNEQIQKELAIELPKFHESLKGRELTPVSEKDK